MPEEAIDRIGVQAEPEACFEVAVAFEEYPVWADDVVEAEVLEWDGQGRGSQVRFLASAVGQRIGYTLGYDYSAAPAELTWNLVDSTLLTALEGSYRFEPDGDRTLVTYRLGVDLELPLPGFLKRKAAGVIIDNALRQFKARVEAT